MPDTAEATAEQAKRADAVKCSPIVRTTRPGNRSGTSPGAAPTAKTKMRRVGPAWLKRRPTLANQFVEGAKGRQTDDEPSSQESWRLDWERCAPRDAVTGALTHQQALAIATDLVRAREVEIDQQAHEAEVAKQGGPLLFEQAADNWLTYGIKVGGTKQSNGQQPPARTVAARLIRPHV